MIRVELEAPADVACLIDGLLEAADRWDADGPQLAGRYRRLADRIGDALDELPFPSGYRAEVEACVARAREART